MWHSAPTPHTAHLAGPSRGWGAARQKWNRLSQTEFAVEAARVGGRSLRPPRPDPGNSLPGSWVDHAATQVFGRPGRPQLCVQGWGWLSRDPREWVQRLTALEGDTMFPIRAVFSLQTESRILSVLAPSSGGLPPLAHLGICRWAFQERCARRQRRADPLWDRYRF